MAIPNRIPGSLPVAEAMSQSEALAALLQRMQASNARYDVIRPQLRAGLAGQVRPGPLDDQGWTLLVGSGAAAAKLRQCLPALAAALRAQGWADLPIRIKVSVPSG